MKKFHSLLALVVLISFGLFSCDKENETTLNVEKESDFLIGKWEYSKYGSIVDGKEVIGNYGENIPNCNKNFIELLADGNGSIHQFKRAECRESVDTFFWTLNNSKIEFSEPYKEFKILELTATKLKIQYKYSGSDTWYIDEFLKK